MRVFLLLWVKLPFYSFIGLERKRRDPAIGRSFEPESPVLSPSEICCCCCCIFSIGSWLRSEREIEIHRPRRRLSFRRHIRSVVRWGPRSLVVVPPCGLLRGAGGVVCDGGPRGHSTSIQVHPRWGGDAHRQSSPCDVSCHCPSLQTKVGAHLLHRKRPLPSGHVYPPRGRTQQRHVLGPCRVVPSGPGGILLCSVAGVGVLALLRQFPS